MRRTAYPGDLLIDMVHEDEVDYHYLDTPDPLYKSLGDEEGHLMRCLCWPLITFAEDGTMKVWHRNMTGN